MGRICSKVLWTMVICFGVMAFSSGCTLVRGSPLLPTASCLAAYCATCCPSSLICIVPLLFDVPYLRIAVIYITASQADLLDVRQRRCLYRAKPVPDARRCDTAVPKILLC